MKSHVSQCVCVCVCVVWVCGARVGVLMYVLFCVVLCYFYSQISYCRGGRGEVDISCCMWHVASQQRILREAQASTAKPMRESYRMLLKMQGEQVPPPLPPSPPATAPSGSDGGIGRAWFDDAADGITTAAGASAGV